MYQNEGDDEGTNEFLGAALLWGAVAFVVASVAGMMATDNIWRGLAFGAVAAVAVAAFMLMWAVPGLLIIGTLKLVYRLFGKRFE